MQESIIKNYTGYDVYLHLGAEAVHSSIKMNEIDIFLAKCLKIPSDGLAKVQMLRDSEALRFRGKKLSINYCNISEAVGLPEPEENTWYIVTQIVYNSVFHIRKDVLLIDYTIKNQNGKVIACRSLTRSVYSSHIGTVKTAVNFLQEQLSVLPFEKVNKLIVSLNKYLER